LDNYVFTFTIYAIKLLDAVTLGGAYNGGKASAVFQKGHVMSFNERHAFSSDGGVGYSR